MSETENANVNVPKYRTERLAEEAYEDLREVPEKLFLLSHKDYQSSFDYQVTDGENSPHMRMLKEGLDIQFENGQLTIGGNPASKVDLIDMYTKKDITKLDTVMLRNLFSIIWFNLRDDIDDVAPVATKQDENDFYDHMSPHEKHRSQIEKWIDFDRWWRRNLYGYTIRIYVPKFMAYLGYDANYSQARHRLWVGTDNISVAADGDCDSPGGSFISEFVNRPPLPTTLVINDGAIFDGSHYVLWDLCFRDYKLIR